MERVRDRCPPDVAEVPRSRLPVLAEDLRPEGEDAALEGVHRQRQCELRHGVELHLCTKALQRAGTRKGSRSHLRRLLSLKYSTEIGKLRPSTCFCTVKIEYNNYYIYFIVLLILLLLLTLISSIINLLSLSENSYLFFC